MTPELETKDFITAKAVAELHCGLSQFPTEGHDRCLHVQCVAGPKGNTELGSIHCFYSGRSLLFVQRKMPPHSSRLPTANTALRNGLGKELSGSCFLGIHRDAQGLWKRP